jgi:response regulator RpfG family c-di-GMP phosphodiesterase
MEIKFESKATIMIVDDEARVRDIISRKLTAEGYKCITAPDGSSALTKVQKYQVDLVLLDVIMPRKSGTAVLRELRSRYEDIAVIMVTAVSDIETAIKLMKMGAYDYIIKPIDLNVLSISVDRALEKRRLLLENKSYRLHLEDKLKEQTITIRESFLYAFKALAFALEARDEYTSGHSERVTELAVTIAEGMSISQDMIQKIRLAGLVHDIGKIGVKETILNKPEPLTAEEYSHVQSHCETGSRILLPIVDDDEILDIVIHHHERYDGKGYPDRLSGEQTSLGARIVAVADAYDAMTSTRPYRDALSIEEAIDEIQKNKGSQFDPDIADVFVSIINRKKETYLQKHVTSAK